MEYERSACRKLESAQMRVGKRLLGASNSGVEVQEDVGLRKLKESSEDESVVW